MNVSPPNLEALARLVDLLYASAYDDAWDPFLIAVADALGGQSAALVSHDLSATGGVGAFARFDPETARLYDQYFHKCDPFAWSLRRRSPTDRVGIYTGEMLISRSEFLRTEFYNDFCVQSDITRMVTAIVQTSADREADSVSGLTIQRRERDHAFDPTDMPLLRALHPHLERALEVRHRLRVASRTEQLLTDVFELLPAAAIILDRRGRVVRANRRADTLLARGDGLIVRDGILGASMSGDGAQLQAVCAAAAASPWGEPRPGATLTVRRQASMWPLRLVVAPLVPDRPPAGDQGACTLVLVDEPDLGPRLSIELLRRLYGLTKTEAEIAARIGHGESLEDIAAVRACSLQTVQWHNKRILAKVGCRSRRELVRRLSLSVAGLVGGD
jgi:DNA-binding CsgD family transcriptional regulator/PAS domain-containing protein